MDLQLNDQLFLVGGATSGFGKAVAEALLREGARIIAVARTAEKLQELQQTHPFQVEIVTGDLTRPGTVEAVLHCIGNRRIEGALINAGGPPAMKVLETTLADWDAAYHSVLRWKVELTQRLIPLLAAHRYGRLVFVESASVKQPMENLVLSNALRLAVVGFVKTLSQEVAQEGITLNILAPGYHATPAMDRLFRKKSEQTGLSMEEAMLQYVSQTPVGFLGAADDFAGLACWLLSPHSRYLTGQTISVDGGVVRGTMG
ncbi:MAG TPA: SDR family oxidoreductase [Lacibacter sp.]|nr:SDR family oxidoreductase [Lacibacter sp.]HMO88159.1 SDR family oxidoreductase [Lacibacter sp.]